MRGAHCLTNSVRGSGNLEGERTCAWTELIIRKEMNAAMQMQNFMMAFNG